MAVQQPEIFDAFTASVNVTRMHHLLSKPGGKKAQEPGIFQPALLDAGFGSRSRWVFPKIWENDAGDLTSVSLDGQDDHWMRGDGMTHFFCTQPWTAFSP